MLGTLGIAFLIACLVAAPMFALAETTESCSPFRHVAMWLYAGLLSVLLSAVVLLLLPWHLPQALAAAMPFLCLVALDLGVCWRGRRKRRSYPGRSLIATRPAGE